MRQNTWCLLLIPVLVLGGRSSLATAQSDAEGMSKDSLTSIAACRKLLQVRPIATTRDKRFLGKGHEQPVSPPSNACRAGAASGAGPCREHLRSPWARDRGEYYSLAWKPRPGAETDEAFKQ